MNELEIELKNLEDELKQLRPSAPPADFEARLVRQLSRLDGRAAAPLSANGPRWNQLRQIFLPLGAAAAALILGVTFWFGTPPRTAEPLPVMVERGTGAESEAGGTEPDQLEIGTQLLASFDAIAELPDGSPVRFECRQWEDRVIFRNPNTGVSFERLRPRLEIVPVSFETY